MIMQLSAKQGDNEVTIPAWLWGSIGALLLLTVGGLGTWFGATIFDHEKRITATEANVSSINNSITRIENGVDRLNEKFDKLLERTAK
jgi:peptidoglycan hydrolase CwlO-like protein